MSKPKLSDFLNGESLLDDAFAHPSLKTKPRSTKRPTIEIALKAVESAVEHAAINHMAEEIEPKLQEAYDNHTLMEGERETVDDAESWDETLEAAVEEVLDEYKDILSQDWLGQHTTSIYLHEEGAIHKYAMSFGKEYFKQIVHGLTPVKILSSAGITKAEVQTRLDTHLEEGVSGEGSAIASDGTPSAELQDIVERIAFSVGEDHDGQQVLEELDLVSDDDDGLAYGAAKRLGLEPEDVPVLQAERLEYGKSTADMLHRLIVNTFGGGEAAEEPETVAKPKKATAKKEAKVKEPAAPAAPKPDKKVTAPKAETSGAIPSSVLQQLKYVGGQDTETARGVGVSRQTYVNYTTGKTEFDANEDQRAFIRGEIVARANAALEALATLDGDAEPHTVF